MKKKIFHLERDLEACTHRILGLDCNKEPRNILVNSFEMNTVMVCLGPKSNFGLSKKRCGTTIDSTTHNDFFRNGSKSN